VAQNLEISKLSCFYLVLIVNPMGIILGTLAKSIGALPTLVGAPIQLGAKFLGSQGHSIVRAC